MSSFWGGAGGGLLAGGIGGGLSALGGVLGAGAQRTATNQARDMYLQNAIEGKRQLGSLLYGDGYWSGFAADPNARQYGLYHPESPVTSIVQHRPDQPSANSILGRQTALGDLYENRSRGIQSDFDAGAANLRGLYANSEGLASQFGQGGEALIDQDSARSLKAANRVAGADLASRGFGNSTMLATVKSQNQMNSAREGAKAKLGLRQQALDRILGVRGQRAASDNTNLGRRADLQNSSLNNLMLYRQQPIQTELNAQMSNVMNPLLGQNTSQYFSGVSPGGTALTTAGNALGTAGGYMMGRGSGRQDPYGLYGNSFSPTGRNWEPE